MPRRTAPSRPRGGVSGKTRVCAGPCGETVEHAIMHPKLKVFLCASCTTLVETRAQERSRRENPAEDREIRRMMQQNRKPDGWGS